MRRIALVAAVVAALTACSSDHAVTPNGPAPIPQALEVVATARSTCLLTTTHDVYCFGSDSAGTLGRDSLDTLPHTTPVQVTGGQSFTQLAGGGQFMCALAAQGQPWCWGTTQTFAPRTTFMNQAPTAVPGAPALTSLSASGVFACGLTAAGQAYCWGENESGQLGTGDTLPRATPALVQGGITWALITAGLDHTCGLTGTSALYCWGDNEAGAVATNAARQQKTPFQIDTTPAFVSLHAGAEYTCGVTFAGAGYCWGYGLSGVLGDSAGTYLSTPSPVVGGITWVLIAPSRENDVLNVNCGVSIQENAYCWGYVNNGGLGNPSAQGVSCMFGSQANQCIFIPVQVSGGIPFISIAVGDDHACGVTPTGAVYCWGKNDKGQLGTGTTQDSDVPVRVLGFGTT